MAIRGLIYLIIIFALCFIFVHTVKLAIIGFKAVRKKKREKSKPAPEKKPEPVYYIVEKKRAKKANYSEPKEIKFK